MSKVDSNIPAGIGSKSKFLQKSSQCKDDDASSISDSLTDSLDLYGDTHQAHFLTGDSNLENAESVLKERAHDIKNPSFQSKKESQINQKKRSLQ